MSEGSDGRGWKKYPAERKACTRLNRSGSPRIDYISRWLLDKRTFGERVGQRDGERKREERERERDERERVTGSSERDVVAKCAATRCGSRENWRTGEKNPRLI